MFINKKTLNLIPWVIFSLKGLRQINLLLLNNITVKQNKNVNKKITKQFKDILFI